MIIKVEDKLKVPLVIFIIIVITQQILLTSYIYSLFVSNGVPDQVNIIPNNELIPQIILVYYNLMNTNHFTVQYALRLRSFLEKYFYMEKHFFFIVWTNQGKYFLVK